MSNDPAAGPPMTPAPLARVIVLAGPSGGGKSRLAGRLRLPVVPLDDFYRAADDEDMPRTPQGAVDWESPRSWDGAGAVRAVVTLCTTAEVHLPVYSFSANRAVDTRRVRLDEAHLVVAEGLFAAEILDDLRACGLLAVAIVLANPPARTLVRRMLRDIAERRKPLPTIIRLGWERYRSDPGIVRALVAEGATPMTNAAAEAYLGGLLEPRESSARSAGKTLPNLS